MAHFANEQPYAQETVPDDHPDIKKYYSDIKEAKALAKAEAEKNDPVRLLQAKVAELETIINGLKENNRG
jgi:hypothetical protein